MLNLKKNFTQENASNNAILFNLIRLASHIVPSFSRKEEKRELSNWAGENANWHNYFEEQFDNI